MASPSLHISEEQVWETLQPVPLVDELERSLLDWKEGRACNHPRARAVLGKQVLHSLSAISEPLDRAACKTYLSGPNGVRFVTSLFELSSNRLLATVDSDRLGQLRTGAATAVAVRHLACPSLDLALLGAGTVARGQLEVLAACFRPRLRSIRCWSPRRAQELSDWAADQLGLSVTVVGTAEEAVRPANLVVTATSAARPILQGTWLGPQGLLCAVGANWAHRREIDAAATLRCQWWVDDLVQARVEAGDFLQVPEFDWATVQSFPALLGGRELRDSGWLGFQSLGLGLEDLVAAALVYRATTGLP